MGMGVGFMMPAMLANLYSGATSTPSPKGNRCPQCGSVVQVPGGQATAAPAAKKTCKKCGQTVEASDLVCPHCGHTSWGNILGILALSLLLSWAVISFWKSNPLIWTGLAILSLALFIFSLVMTIKGIQVSPRVRERQRNRIRRYVEQALKEEQVTLRYSVGIGTLGENYTEIIPAGQKLPHLYSSVFSNAEDNQTQVEIKISQKRPEGIRIICSPILRDLPPSPKASLSIALNVTVDVNKRLFVKATIAEPSYEKEYGPFKVE